MIARNNGHAINSHPVLDLRDFVQNVGRQRLKLSGRAVYKTGLCVHHCA
jgi:hypothetical protein